MDYRGGSTLYYSRATRFIQGVSGTKHGTSLVRHSHLFFFFSNILKFNPEEEKAAAQSKKLSKLAAMEQKWREEQQGGKSSWFWSSFAASFSSTVAENLQVGNKDMSAFNYNYLYKDMPPINVSKIICSWCLSDVFL